jgi:protein-S-isoprenylcysteine O-methyltransferase Ste14
MSEVDDQVARDSSEKGPRAEMENASPAVSGFAIPAMVALTMVVGYTSLLAFFTFAFTGSFNLVRLGLSEPALLAHNAGLSLLFFIQHSTMLRTSFRRWFERFVRTEYHGAIYTMTSGALLLLLVVFWQESSHTLASAQGIPRWIMRGLFLLGILGFRWSLQALEKFDGFGIGPLLHLRRGTTPRKNKPFKIAGPYRYVRHPQYFCALLMIWSCPDLTTDRLLFNSLWTAYIIIGAIFEERDLTATFGQEYREYQAKVPMLVPYRFRAYG